MKWDEVASFNGVRHSGLESAIVDVVLSVSNVCFPGFDDITDAAGGASANRERVPRVDHSDRNIFASQRVESLGSFELDKARVSYEALVLLQLFWQLFGEAVWSVARVIVPEVNFLRFRLVKFEIYSASFAVVAGPYEI